MDKNILSLINERGVVLNILKHVDFNTNEAFFSLIEEAYDRKICTLTRSAMLVFLDGKITVYDSNNLPFNFKTLEQEMLINLNGIKSFIEN